MVKAILKVLEIRNKKILITKEPIVYYWWFKVNCKQALPLPATLILSANGLHLFQWTYK